MKKILILISMIMILLVSVPSALAYFYTYTKAAGTMTVKLEDKSEIEEEFDNKNKVITITADKDSDPVFVRVKVFSDVEVKYEQGANWSATADSNNYYYYNLPIDGKDSSTNIAAATSSFKVSITYPATAENGDQYDIFVAYEATPAMFSETDPGDGVKIKWFDSIKKGYWYTNWTSIPVE